MAVVSSGVCLQPQAWHIDGGVALLLVVLRAWLSLIFFMLLRRNAAWSLLVLTDLQNVNFVPHGQR